MPMPTSLLIGGKTYTVKDATWEDMRQQGHEDAKGLTDTLKQEIWIVGSVALESRKECLLHECLHVCWEIGIPTGLTQAEDFNEFQEQIVSALDNPLWQLLRDNQDLVEWICGDED